MNSKFKFFRARTRKSQSFAHFCGPVLSVLSIATVLGYFAFLVRCIDAADWGQGPLRAGWSLLLLCSVALIYFFASRPRGFRATVRRHHPRVFERRNPDLSRRMPWLLKSLLVIAVTALVGWQIRLALYGLKRPQPSDIAYSIVGASRFVMNGQNFYLSPVNQRTESLPLHRNFDGFKYSPLTALVYAPGAVLFGIRGLILTNIFMQILVFIAVFTAAHAKGGTFGGWLAVIAYASFVLVAREAFLGAAPDLAPVVPLLIAFTWGHRRPFLLGLACALSVSVKLSPALFVLPLLLIPALRRFSHSARAWILIGLGVGILPCLFYLAWAPSAFIDNLILFNIMREGDSTSWLEHWPQARTAALIFYACGWFFILFDSWAHDRDRVRLALYLCFVVIGGLLVARFNHRNYQIWWLPWLSVLLGMLLPRLLPWWVSSNKRV